MKKQNAEIIMEVVTDSAELARARSQRERFDRNAAWLQSHAAEVYSRYRGKCICIAGEELFVGDTAKDALTLATAAHPRRQRTLCPLHTARKDGESVCASMVNGMMWQMDFMKTS